MILPLALASLVLVAFGAYLVGFAAGRRDAYREWLLALTADFDDVGTWERILGDIEDEKSA